MDEEELQVVIVWKDKSREPLKSVVKNFMIQGSFVCLFLTDDMLSPGTKEKVIYFPCLDIDSVQHELREVKKQPEGYREENTFREGPEKSPWFGGMGNEKTSQET